MACQEVDKAIKLNGTQPVSPAFLHSIFARYNLTPENDGISAYFEYNQQELDRCNAKIAELDESIAQTEKLDRWFKSPIGFLHFLAHLLRHHDDDQD